MINLILAIDNSPHATAIREKLLQENNSLYEFTTDSSRTSYKGVLIFHGEDVEKLGYLVLLKLI